MSVPSKRIVQARVDEPGYIAPLEREVGRLSHTLELARDAEVERLIPQQSAEPTRLLAPSRGQPDGHGGVTVQPADRRILALAVTREDD
jgi:hypothetical protein